MFVASGQGLMAVSKPSRKAVTTGRVEPSSNCCSDSMGLQFKQFFDFARQEGAELSGFVRALSKAGRVRLTTVSAPSRRLCSSSDDHATP